MNRTSSGLHSSFAFALGSVFVFAGLVSPSAVAQVNGSGTTNKIPKFTGPTTIGDSLITERNGKIGIGTANPLLTLDVVGGASFRGSTSGATPVFFGNQGGSGPILDFRSAQISRFFIDNTGNVGIGTVTPAATLDVMGDVRGRRGIFGEVRNSATGNFAFVTGGVGFGGPAFANTASGDYSFVGGGYGNTASGPWSWVIGGEFGDATAEYAVVAGGDNGLASGRNSIVLGGRANQAGGRFSLAAGRRAKVRTGAQAGNVEGDEGTFVWADGQDADFTSTGNNKFLIRAAGGVGIGTTSPTAGFQLDVNGNIRCVGLTQTSSREFKQDIQPLTGALDSIMKLQGVSYAWNDKAPEQVQGKHDIGFMADEMNAVLPDIVAKDENGKPVGIDYGKITPVAVEAIKQLKTENDQMKLDNEKLTARLAKIEALLAERGLNAEK